MTQYLNRTYVIEVKNILGGSLGFKEVDFEGKFTDEQVDRVLKREAEQVAAMSGEPIQYAGNATYTIKRTVIRSEWDADATDADFE